MKTFQMGGYCSFDVCGDRPPVKSEIRNSKFETSSNSSNPNVQNQQAKPVLSIACLNFEFVSEFGFRISSLGLIKVATHSTL